MGVVARLNARLTEREDKLLPIVRELEDLIGPRVNHPEMLLGIGTG